MLRTSALFVASAFFGVALACGGAKSTTATASTNADAATEASAEAAPSMCKYKSQALAAVDVSTAEGEKAQVSVAGMTCQSCATSVQTALMKLDGVNAAQVSATTGTADIAFDAGKTDLDKIIAAANEALDYEVSKVQTES